jgi:NFU1 iron-sulfur cluster scaffold homolog, mitochondrial
MPFDVTEIQPTPNPNAVKFMLNRPISEGSVSFLSPDEAQDHPIAQRLFAIPGVSSLLLLGDFVTVNKDAKAGWPQIKRRVQQVLAEV